MNLWYYKFCLQFLKTKLTRNITKIRTNLSTLTSKLTRTIRYSLKQVDSGSLDHVLLKSSTTLIKKRSSYQRCSMKKGVLGNFTKFTWTHLCQSLIFNKAAGLRPEISKNTFFTGHLRTTASVKKQPAWLILSPKKIELQITQFALSE